uniref:RNA-directed DNA polymerase, eukaryota n=1 Tax=Tanacetum cinerariifolium TaxID=118510 RepID=A0A6L2JY65_TANCI|nr:RNA-directed DNA polymerase, eukaryota [Tanacetum cinerariifolium]
MWDYLLDILGAFGFGPTWCKWIRGTFIYANSSILVNGSPTKEFSSHRGLKQGDPLAPYLFILVMESLHLSFNRAIEEGVFKGILLPGSLHLSHLFYADDAMFLGEWSHTNFHGIVNILKSFYFASGLQINLNKSQLLGVGVPHSDVVNAATLIGCSIMNDSFRYLGVLVGHHSSRLSAWDDTIDKLKGRLSKWKMKTLSIGGRFTLLKSVLGATPIYNMSIFKVPRGILKVMESIRRRFFYGIDPSENKISWVAWNKVLASKNHGGLGISSFFALNRALLLKWIWRFISSDGSLWSKVIQALYGKRIDFHATKFSSIWCSIIRELHQLKDNGFDFWEHCKIRIGNGSTTRFWYDLWIGDMRLYAKFPRLFALDLNKDCSVADKLNNYVELSFRRTVRGGIEQHQMSDLVSMLESIVLSSSNDRWVCGLSNDGDFKVKDIRIFLDHLILPHFESTRWIKAMLLRLTFLLGELVKIASRLG